MKRTLILLLLLARPSGTGAVYDANEIMRQSIAANSRDLEAADDFDHSERQQLPEGSRTYSVLMLFGSPYRHLVAVNDAPLASNDRQREEQRKDAARVARERETPDERARRLDKYEKERRRNRFLLEQMAEAFDLSRETDQSLNGVDAFVIRAAPKQDYRPPNLEAQVLTGVESRFWIEKTTFHWIKVEANVIRPVSIASFLARIDPGTQVTLEQSQVAPDTWFPKRFQMRTRGRILLMFKQRTQLDQTYFGYRRVEQAPRLAN
jgi:hypothetical protein